MTDESLTTETAKQSPPSSSVSDLVRRVAEAEKKREQCDAIHRRDLNRIEQAHNDAASAQAQHLHALERVERAEARVAVLEAALEGAKLQLQFIVQEAKDGLIEVEQGVPNAHTFWLSAIGQRSRAALAGVRQEAPGAPSDAPGNVPG